MQIQEFEKLIISEIKKVVESIISKKIDLSISAKSRAGAEISDYLEDNFVKNVSSISFFIDTKSSPKGAFKNPYDAETFFNFKGHKEKIWIDFKAIKISGKGSNPDAGTPNKIVNLINQSYFYICYVFVYYQETNDGLRFVTNDDNEYVKLYFLKDIHHSFRRNPKNQLQVDFSTKSEYRTREEFIELLFEKLKESHQRQIKISEKALKELENTKSSLIKINKNSENIIKNL